MSDSPTSRQQYIDYILQKFSSMAESIEHIEQRCDEYGRISEESRVAQQADLDQLRQWMMNQEWRDGVLRTAMNTVKDLIETQDAKIEAGNTAQQSIIESLHSEVDALRHSSSPVESSVLEKIQNLEEKLLKLGEKTDSPYAGNIENVLQKMAEYILNENEKNTELREQFEEVKMKLGNHNTFEATLSDIGAIRSGLSEIHARTQNEFAHQDKFNDDVKSDLNRLGACLKELCKMQEKFETDVKLNCCDDCEEMNRIRDCLMNQVLTNRDLQMETGAIKEEMGVLHQEKDALKIKQELFNKSLSLQLKGMRDNVQEYGSDATAKISELRVEINQLKEQHEIQQEKIGTESFDRQQMVESFQTEIANIRQAYSQLGKHSFEELGKLSASVRKETSGNFYVLSSPRSPLMVEPKSSEDSSKDLSVVPVSLEDTVKELVEAALVPYRQEMSMLYKKVDEMSAELNAMKKKQSKKFKGIGRLNAKILSLISTPEKEESLLDKSNN